MRKELPAALRKRFEEGDQGIKAHEKEYELTLSELSQEQKQQQDKWLEGIDAAIGRAGAGHARRTVPLYRDRKTDKRRNPSIKSPTDD